MKIKVIKPLNNILKKNYFNWKENIFPKKKRLFNKLIDKGQKPEFMVLSCSDSRVNISSIFNEVEGKFFTHRNIANIVPAYERKKINNCTGSVLEYAVNTLYVKNIIILGHSNCGGVKAFYDNKKKKK